MEIVGGFMVMMSIISFFIAVIWLVMPFVVLSTKGKQDRTLDLLAVVEKRLVAIEGQLNALQQAKNIPVDPDAEKDQTADTNLI